MTSIIHMAAILFPAGSRSKKNSGTPTSAPAVKQTSCLRVRLNMTLVLTLVLNLWVRVHKPMWKPPSVLMRLKD